MQHQAELIYSPVQECKFSADSASCPALLLVVRMRSIGFQSRLTLRGAIEWLVCAWQRDCLVGQSRLSSFSSSRLV